MKLNINILLTNQPIAYPPEAWKPCPSTGALAEFYGIVRPEENGEPIQGLHYEAYHSMAETEMCRLINELGKQYPCHFVGVIHRLGDIPAGEVAIYIQTQARHRTEAFAMLSTFMDRLKQDVPIWKTGVLS